MEMMMTRQDELRAMVAAATPGPWHWDAGLVPPDGPETYADIYVDGGETIIAGFNDLIPKGRANARLIAQAPTLAVELAAALDRVAALEAVIAARDAPQPFECECGLSGPCPADDCRSPLLRRTAPLTPETHDWSARYDAAWPVEGKT
jgi:hypothetical protein